MLHDQLDFATYEINSFSYKEEKKPLPWIDETLDITASNYGIVTGKRLFIMPNVMSKSKRKLSVDSTRKYDIQLGFEYNDIDSVEIELPKGYTAESLPKPVSVTGKFGNYSSSVKMDGNKLYYYRNIEQYSGRYPASEDGELVKFFETVFRADHNKLVLVKD